MKIVLIDQNTFEIVGGGEEIDDVRSWLEQIIKRDYLLMLCLPARKREVFPDDVFQVFFWHEKDAIMLKMVWA